MAVCCLVGNYLGLCKLWLLGVLGKMFLGIGILHLGMSYKGGGMRGIYKRKESKISHKNQFNLLGMRTESEERLQQVVWHRAEHGTGMLDLEERTEVKICSYPACFPGWSLVLVFLCILPIHFPCFFLFLEFFFFFHFFFSLVTFKMYLLILTLFLSLSVSLCLCISV